MSLSDWEENGQCVGVDYSKVRDLAEYHPEKGPDYAVIAEIDEDTKDIIILYPCELGGEKYTGSWGTRARLTMDKMRLKLFLDDAAQDGEFLEAQDIPIARIDGWKLTSWRIDKTTHDGKPAFKDTLSWEKGGDTQKSTWTWGQT
jgi:hypothetical protein